MNEDIAKKIIKWYDVAEDTKYNDDPKKLYREYRRNMSTIKSTYKERKSQSENPKKYPEMPIFDLEDFEAYVAYLKDKHVWDMDLKRFFGIC